MALSTGYQRYQQTQVTTLGRGKLLLMAYDGAIRFIREAKNHTEVRDYERKNESILKAQRIISELASTLNHNTNPDLADNLLKLYQYMIDTLFLANVRDDLDKMTEVEKLLLSLREAWAEADRVSDRAEAVL